MKRALLLLVVALGAALLAGCASEEKAAPESPDVKAEVEQAKSAWTEEQKAKYQEALNRAKDGSEGGDK